MKKLLLLFLLLLPILSNAQTAKFDKIWLEFDVFQGGEKGMRVHTKFHTYSMKDMTGKVVVFFYHQDGSPVKDLNDNYRTTDGNVSCSDKFSPTYENSLYEDFKVFIPYSEIHMLPGEHSYKCYAAVYSNSLGKYISNSDWTYFTGTGVKEVQKIFPEGKSFSFASDDGNNLFITFVINNNNEQQATVWVDYSRTELYHWDYNTSDGLGFNGYDLKPVQEIIGYDFFGNPIKSFFSGKYTTTRNDNSFILQADYSSLVLNGKYYKRVETKKYYGGGNYYSGGNNYYNSGSSSSSSSSSTYQTCTECHGSGYCTLCHGRGYTFNSYSGHDDQCPRCFGNGRCFMCRGSGHL